MLPEKPDGIDTRTPIHHRQAFGSTFSEYEKELPKLEYYQNRTEAIKPMSTVQRGSNISRFGEKAETEMTSLQQTVPIQNSG